MSVDVEEAVSETLRARVDVLERVAERVFINRVPQREQLPAVIIRRVSGSPYRVADGVIGVRHATFQIESWAETSQEDARDLDRVVQNIDGTRGAVGSWWLQAVRLNQDSDQDQPQIPTHADDLGLFCSVSEFFVVYQPRA